MADSYRGLLGVLVLTALAVCLSSAPRRIAWRTVLAGFGLQAALAWLLLTFPPTVAAFEWLAAGFNRVISFADEGSKFVFGSLSTLDGAWGFVFAFRVLPVIIFFASFMSILYHYGIMQRVIAAMAFILRHTMRVTGAEAVVCAANVFVGQTEAPLCVKPLIPCMTRAQLATLMVGGFATIAGSVMAAYVGILGGDDEAQRILFAKHLITASVMSAPAALAMAKIIEPEVEHPPDEHVAALHFDTQTHNLLDAAAAGATDGLRLALNVAAMLIAFVALLALANYPIELLGNWGPIAEWRAAHGVGPLSLQMLLGWLFRPLAWTLGVPWSDAGMYGSLLGTQLIATEFVAYQALGAAVQADPPLIGQRAAEMATYGLCGFANFPSIAIQIGGLTGIAPERRTDFARLGLRAMLAGALACWQTSCIAGLFIG